MFRKLFKICTTLFIISIGTVAALLFVTPENTSNPTELNYGLDSVYNCQRCSVNASTVDCSYSNCTQIPKGLPHTTEQLIMRGNRLKSITPISFIDLRQLLYLDLSNCSINTIEPKSFDQVVRLKVLNLSLNPFLQNYPEHLFSFLNHLTQLFLSGTREPCKFSLDLIRNLTKLEVLWFGPSQIFQFPRLFNHSNSTLFPYLKELNFEGNNLVNLDEDSYKGLDALETLILSGNRIITLPSQIFKRFKRLRRLVMDRNYFTPGAFSFSSESLKDLSLNYITPHYSVARKAFSNISNLERLSLERSPELAQTAITAIASLPKLVMLNLRGIGVTSDMLQGMTARLPKLRYLDLSDNDIDILSATMFNNLELEVLLLNSNWLTIVDITSLPLTTWRHLQRVDFSNNLLLECDCSIVWFRRWLRDPRRKAAVDNIRDTNCSVRGENNGLNSVSIYHLEEPTNETCFKYETDLCITAVLVIVVVIGFISSTTSMLHRFRWQIKYYYFQQVVQSRQTKDVADYRHFIFDAFICYSDFDRSWVINHLRPKLETEFHLRLCIRDRDWLVGPDIVDNVVESIANSRKTVLIVSNTFAVSHWRHFEMTMAQTKFSEDDRDSLILVLLEEIADCNMNPRLQLQMQKKTYIEWTADNQIGQQLFWAQLRQAVARNAGSIIDAVPPQELFASMVSET